MYIVHEAVAGADKSKKTKEKMQMECSSVRREMACCAALRPLGIDTHPTETDRTGHPKAPCLE